MFMGMYHGGNYGAIKWACVILSELLSLLYDLTLLLSSQNAFNDVESSLTDIPSNQFDLWHDYHQKLHIDCGPRGPPRSAILNLIACRKFQSCPARFHIHLKIFNL